MGSVAEALPAPSMRRHRILFVDAYDSFSNNITSLLTTLLDVDVSVLPIDAPITRDALRRELGRYNAVVCGPGPGSPDHDADVGLMRWLWEEEEDLVPVLGVCLGFQSLALACGARIRRLRRGLHGMVRTVVGRRCSVKAAAVGVDDGDDEGGNLFCGVGEFRATLYHSLCADVGQDAATAADWEGGGRWDSPPGCPDLVPLAWVEEDYRDDVGCGDDGNDGDAPGRTGADAERILMALKHRRKPFWGLQYHPESVCTEAAGDQVVRNWFREALRWNLEHGRVVSMATTTTTTTIGPDRDVGLVARSAVRTSLLQQVRRAPRRLDADDDVWGALLRGLSGGGGRGRRLRYGRRSVALRPGIEVPDLAEVLNAANMSHAVLESANGAQPPPDAGVDVRGRFSVVAVDVDECLRIEHHAGEAFVTVVVDGGGARHRVALARGQSVWHLLAEFHESRRAGLEETTSTTTSCSGGCSGGVPGEDEVPFLGGFVGFITYEQGLSDIDVALPRARGHKRPDVCLAWVTKSIVVDHRMGVLHAQDLESEDGNSDKSAWVDSILKRLQDSAVWQDDDHQGRTSGSCHPPPSDAQQPVIQMPERAKYEAKVRLCQEYIAAGESYELCLTDQTHITLPAPARRPCVGESTHTQTRRPREQKETSSPPADADAIVPAPAPAPALASDSSWRLYRALRERNPAPFASYLRLGGATLVSSSPERFLTHDRSGLCSMKPMKGTVKKDTSSTSSLSPSFAAAGGSPAGARSLAEAEAILHVPKEEAENLMIVDLVRHDLHGVCGAGAVGVPELLKVEEYQTVYTMITRVEGQLPPAPAPAPGTRTKTTTEGAHSGLDVLAASLPPGSMTGAPKRRSCEILRRVEGPRERSLYSGVVGYMCVSGRGDWSVTIRSLFRWDDETTASSSSGNADGGVNDRVEGQREEQRQEGGEEGQEVWHIGAGGAVTILSTPEGEREEMFVKLARPLSMFTGET